MAEIEEIIAKALRQNNVGPPHKRKARIALAALESAGYVIVPKEPSPKQLRTVARSIGHTASVSNHIERARQAILAYFDGDHPIPGGSDD